MNVDRYNLGGSPSQDSSHHQHEEPASRHMKRKTRIPDDSTFFMNRFPPGNFNPPDLFEKNKWYLSILSYTPRRFNSSPLKNDCLKMNFLLAFGLFFRGELLNIQECITSHPIESMELPGIYIYTDPWKVDFMVNRLVGKYTRPMEH